MSAQPDVSGTVFDGESFEVVLNYAQALVNVAEAQGQTSEVLDELDEFVADVLEANPQFAELLSTPSVAAHDKDRILAGTFGGRASETLVRFLRVLNKHGRLGLVAPIARQARALWDRSQNRIPVTVRSAVPLGEEQRSSLYERLGRMIAATPVVDYRVDPSLIGGLVVQVGDEVYDASVRSRLQSLRKQLVEGRVRDLQGRRHEYIAT